MLYAAAVQGYLAVVDEPLVSVDFRGSDVSTSIDASLTMVLGDDLVKVVAWYGEPFFTPTPTSGRLCRICQLGLTEQDWQHAVPASQTQTCRLQLLMLLRCQLLRSTKYAEKSRNLC